MHLNAKVLPRDSSKIAELAGNRGKRGKRGLGRGNGMTEELGKGKGELEARRGCQIVAGG
jgi:hypothetical protein